MSMPVPRIQYCARCNAEQWHEPRTREEFRTTGHETMTYTIAYAYTCNACGHESDPDTSCRHSPPCVVPHGNKGANTSPQIRADLARQARQASRRKWGFGIPVIVVTVLFIACAGIWFVKFAGDSSAGGGRSAHCVLAYQTAERCESTDPKVDLAAVWLADASSCTFNITIQWGDGSPAKPVNVKGGRTGQTVIGSHTYAKPGTYAVVATNKVRSGSCRTVDGHYSFTLTKG